MREISVLKQRLLVFLDSKGITKAQFYRDTSISNGILSQASGFSEDNIVRILNTYKNLNEHWWLTGEGTMEREGLQSPANELRVDYRELNTMLVPLVNQYAYGGYLSGFADPHYIEELPKVPFIVDREYRGEYRCFEVRGDSMDDGSDEAIKDRDLILCRNVNKEYWRNKLHINKWDFVIVHRYDGIAVKRIVEHDIENGTLTLHSLNDYYDDYKINLKDVDQIFNVVDVKRDRKRK